MRQHHKPPTLVLLLTVLYMYSNIHHHSTKLQWNTQRSPPPPHVINHSFNQHKLDSEVAILTRTATERLDSDPRHCLCWSQPKERSSYTSNSPLNPTGDTHDATLNFLSPRAIQRGPLDLVVAGLGRAYLSIEFVSYLPVQLQYHCESFQYRLPARSPHLGRRSHWRSFRGGECNLHSRSSCVWLRILD